MAASTLYSSPPPPSPSCRSDFGKQPPSFPKCLVYFHPIILLIVTSPLETIFVTLGRWLQDISCEYTILCVMYTKNLFFSWLHLSGISHSVLCYLLFVCNCLWNVPFLSENCFYTFFFPAYTLKKKRDLFHWCFHWEPFTSTEAFNCTKGSL